MLTVHLRITDAATKRPVPARVRVTDAGGTHFAPLGRDMEFPTGRNEDVGGHLKLGGERWFYIDGACEMPLPAGVPLRVQAAKGPEWTPLDATVTLGTGQISLRFALERWTDSRADGWASVDTRCHFIDPHAALLEAQAEDLDAVNLLAVPYPVLARNAETYTTVPHLLAFSGQTAAVERAGHAVVVNTLNTHPVLGKVALLNSHRPIFPLTFGGEESDDWGVCDWCDQCHRKGGLVVWVDAFETAGGVVGGEALVAAILGKIDAIEVNALPRKTPLFPWVYRLWDAGVFVPVVGASGKSSNAAPLGAMRTYARTQGETWVEAVRAGRAVVTSGPLLALACDGQRFTATCRARGEIPPVEIIANGRVVATGAGQAEVDATEPGWCAARTTGGAGFAHTSPVVVGAVGRKPAAVAALTTLSNQTREWVEVHGRFHNAARKRAIIERCAEAERKIRTGG